jgi:hypothetical protein
LERIKIYKICILFLYARGRRRRQRERYAAARKRVVLARETNAGSRKSAPRFSGVSQLCAFSAELGRQVRQRHAKQGAAEQIGLRAGRTGDVIYSPLSRHEAGDGLDGDLRRLSAKAQSAFAGVC